MLGSRWRWGLGAFCCFLGVTVLAPEGPLVAQEPTGGTPRRAAVAREIGDAFGDLGALLARREVELRGQARKSGSTRLRSTLSAWAVELEAGSADVEQTRHEILEALEEARQEAELELLFLVTDDGGVFVPAVDVEPSDATLLLLAGPVFSSGRSTSGVQPLLEVTSFETNAPETEKAPELFLAVASPFQVSGSAPAACLIAAIPFSSVTTEVDDLLFDSTVKLRWHLYQRLGVDEAVIQDGSAQNQILSRAFVDQVQSPGRDVNTILESELGLGLWNAFDSASGKSAGGWGITADPDFVAALLAAETTSPEALEGSHPPTASQRIVRRSKIKADTAVDDATISLILYCVAGSGVAAILWFFLNSWHSRRRRRALLDRVTATPATGQAPRSFPEAPEPVANTLIAQFEINWKTFSSYMQDLLQEKLKPLENSPRETVDRLCDCVAGLSDNVTQLRQDFQGTQTEIRGASDDLAQRLSEAVNGLATAAVNDDSAAAASAGLSEASDKAIGQILEELQETRARFGVLDTALIRLAEVFGEGREDMVVARVAEEKATLEADMKVERQKLTAESRELREELASLQQAHDEQQAGRQEAEARERECSEEVAIATRERDEEFGRRTTELEETVREKDSLLQSTHDSAAELESQLEKNSAALQDANTRVAELEGAAESRATDSEAYKQQCELLQATVAELEGRLTDRTEMAARLEGGLAASRDREREAVRTAEQANGESQQRVLELESELETNAVSMTALASELVECRQREEAAATALAKVETGESESTRRIAELESNLTTHTARVLELEGKLADVRERSEETIRRQMQEFEKERETLSERIAEATAEATRRGDAAQTTAREADRFRELSEAQKRALDERDEHLAKLREARDALEQSIERERQETRAAKAEETRLIKEVASREKRLQQLADEARTSSSELARLRDSERTRGEELAKLEGQVGSLRAEVNEARAKLDSTRKRHEAQLAELDRKEAARGNFAVELEGVVRQRENELRETNDARLQLKTKLAEAEAAWHSKLADLELKVSDADRGGKALSGQLADAHRTIRQLEEELSDARTTGVSADWARKVAALEDGKRGLTRNLQEATTELEVAQREAEQSLRFQKALVNGNEGTALVGLDSSLRVFSWNDQAQVLWGLSAASAVGKALGELDMNGIDAATREAVERVAKEGRGVALQRVAVKGSSGEELQIEVRLDPIVALDDRGHGVVVVAVDVTDRAEHELETRVAGIFNESLVKSLPAALVVADAHDRVIRWNRGAEAVFGIAEGDAVGSELFTLPTPLARAPFQKKFAMGKKDGTTTRVRVKLDSGRVAGQYLLTQCPFLGADDTVRGTVLLLQEIQVNVEA